MYPQRLVLAHLLFNIYIVQLLKFMHKPPYFHIYSGDIQLFFRCTDNISEYPTIIASAIIPIHQCLSANSLAFNPLKTEKILPFTTQQQTNTHHATTFHHGHCPSDNQHIPIMSKTLVSQSTRQSTLTITSPISQYPYTTISQGQMIKS